MVNFFTPLRIFADQGAALQWDNLTQTITIVGNGNTSIIRINSKDITLNGEQKLMNQTSILQNDVTLIPVEYVSVIMGSGKLK
jgi:hypothetical protein